MNLELHSERLTLKPITSAELDLCLEMFTDPQVLGYAGGPLPRTVIEQKMDDWTKRGGEGCIGIWCISDRESGERFGTVALLPMPVDEKDTDFSRVVPGNMPENDIEIGYFLKRSAWGNGYATEACKRLLRFVFEQTPLDEIVATFNPKNLASRNVLLKAGFVDRGTMWSYGEDGPIFRITRNDWLASNEPA